MMNKIYQISEELTSIVREKELEMSDIIRDVPPTILLLENGFIDLKNIVSSFTFPSKHDEIMFFKEIKPQLFSKLIFFRKIHQLELNRPISNYKTIRLYLEREHERINLFYNRNTEFIQYYRSGKANFDEYYFVRGRKDMELNLESFYFERDPRFSTHFDFKVARLLANDMLAAHLNYQLSKLKYQEENDFSTEIEIPSAQWTDKKTALTEIIYSIYEEKSINSGNIEIKALATIFGRIFNVDLNDIYHIYLEIRSRKTNRTEFLNRLIKTLNKRMDEADSK